ncbi:hypothetical protein [Bordetella sp. LUAb4]|uniref:hypothetical protein n=1 Tax=Bordetella sp. LUAb4 TaxID=2843195 RepID=UPI001E3B4E01|nr:hypothetical protein [Bordetella sp. LUAb4]
MTAFQRWLIIALFVAIATFGYIASQLRYSQKVGFNGQVTFVLDRYTGDVCAHFTNGSKACFADFVMSQVKWEDAPEKAPIPPGYELAPSDGKR